MLFRTKKSCKKHKSLEKNFHSKNGASRSMHRVLSHYAHNSVSSLKLGSYTLYCTNFQWTSINTKNTFNFSQLTLHYSVRGNSSKNNYILYWHAEFLINFQNVSIPYRNHWNSSLRLLHRDAHKNYAVICIMSAITIFFAIAQLIALFFDTDINFWIYVQ